MAAATVTVISEEPAPVMGLVPKPTVTPAGSGFTVDNEMEGLPAVTALEMVERPALPGATEIEAGDADRLKSGATVPETLRLTVVV